MLFFQEVFCNLPWFWGLSVQITLARSCLATRENSGDYDFAQKHEYLWLWRLWKRRGGLGWPASTSRQQLLQLIFIICLLDGREGDHMNQYWITLGIYLSLLLPIPLTCTWHARWGYNRSVRSCILNGSLIANIVGWLWHLSVISFQVISFCCVKKILILLWWFIKKIQMFFVGFFFWSVWFIIPLSLVTWIVQLHEFSIARYPNVLEWEKGNYRGESNISNKIFFFSR